MIFSCDTNLALILISQAPPEYIKRESIAGPLRTNEGYNIIVKQTQVKIRSCHLDSITPPFLHLKFSEIKVDKAIKRDLHNKVEGFNRQKLL